MVDGFTDFSFYSRLRLVCSSFSLTSEKLQIALPKNGRVNLVGHSESGNTLKKLIKKIQREWAKNEEIH